MKQKNMRMRGRWKRRGRWKMRMKKKEKLGTGGQHLRMHTSCSLSSGKLGDSNTLWCNAVKEGKRVGT